MEELKCKNCGHTKSQHNFMTRDGKVVGSNCSFHIGEYNWCKCTKYQKSGLNKNGRNKGHKNKD